MKNRKGFTIVELMIAIVIFTIGFLSAYLLIYSAINSSARSKNEIIASNIAREQIELVKNIRDTNWLKNWDWNDLTEILGTGNLGDSTYYVIENDYSGAVPIKMAELNPPFDGTKGKVLGNLNVRLCSDSQGRYSHCVSGEVKTNFYSFIKVEPLVTKNTITNSDVPVVGAFRIESVVVNNEKGYNEFKINTIITDWKR
ncbi:MAG: type II secretion system protein [Candidatus Gracilibacteria bacterium]|nr:type II secretion system protein [Candidatus Gracilibacteria bacterium]